MTRLPIYDENGNVIKEILYNDNDEITEERFYTYKNKNKYSIHKIYDNNKLKEIKKYTNGKPTKQIFYDNNIITDSIIYYKNGKLFFNQFKEGKMIISDEYTNKEKITEDTYIRCFYEGKHIQEKIFFKKSKYIKGIKYYSESKLVWGKYKFKNGIWENREVLVFNKRGDLYKKYSVFNDKKNGEEYIYNQWGEIIETNIFKDGKNIKDILSFKEENKINNNIEDLNFGF